jgi:hypothetical protein
MTTRAERKRKRRGKQRKAPEAKISNRAIDDLAWKFARAMAKLPRREHVNQKVITHDKVLGCIPYNSQYGYQWCIGCFYENCCTKEIQWRVQENGKLTRY